jgi:ABC-type multidrug transport system fused ATPase/permease subunit
MMKSGKNWYESIRDDVIGVGCIAVVAVVVIAYIVISFLIFVAKVVATALVIAIVVIAALGLWRALGHLYSYLTMSYRCRSKLERLSRQLTEAQSATQSTQERIRELDENDRPAASARLEELLARQSLIEERIRAVAVRWADYLADALDGALISRTRILQRVDSIGREALSKRLAKNRAVEQQLQSTLNAVRTIYQVEPDDPSERYHRKYPIIAEFDKQVVPILRRLF